MKKNISILLLIGLSYISSIAQTPITFNKVITTDSIGKSQLYLKIYEWFASNFNSANDVIQMSDKEAGVIIGNGIMNYKYENTSNSSYDGSVSYKIKVNFKDDRIKVELTDFIHSGKGFNLGLINDSEEYTTKGMYKNYHNSSWKDVKLKCEQYSQSIFISMEEKITIRSDDW
jgi:hypothetical protein